MLSQRDLGFSQMAQAAVRLTPFNDRARGGGRGSSRQACVEVQTEGRALIRDGEVDVLLLFVTPRDSHARGSEVSE